MFLILLFDIAAGAIRAALDAKEEMDEVIYHQMSHEFRLVNNDEVKLRFSICTGNSKRSNSLSPIFMPILEEGWTSINDCKDIEVLTAYDMLTTQFYRYWHDNVGLTISPGRGTAYVAAVMESELKTFFKREIIKSIDSEIYLI